ncbi:MAG TPA: flagellar hook-associated protein FlgK, partial [Bacillota bacterium]|nr:flagellar hook-associated protein FlgK [Bacillota bacterium]
MISTFTGLYTAVRGLYSSQAALTVTSNNISNTDTDGYSRQKVNQTTNSPSADYNGKAIIGTGALVTSVNRVRDPLLDKKYWYQNGSLGEWGVKSSALTEVEEVLNESDNSFSTVMDDFYSALDDLSNNAGDSSARTTVMEAGKTVCTFLNDAAERLSSLQNDANTAVKTTVTQINAYTRQIADLNGQIQQAKVSGAAANDLEDQRDLLIDKLSALTEVTVSETTIGTN